MNEDETRTVCSECGEVVFPGDDLYADLTRDGKTTCCGAYPVPEDPNEAFPTVPKNWEKTCPDCEKGELEVEGYANRYTAVYRCPVCGCSRTYQERGLSNEDFLDGGWEDEL